jgi:hypothetical protein
LHKIGAPADGQTTDLESGIITERYS